GPGQLRHAPVDRSAALHAVARPVRGGVPAPSGGHGRSRRGRQVPRLKRGQAFDRISPQHYLFLAAPLFRLGVFGVLVRRNALVVFMCVELMLNASTLTFLAFARGSGSDAGHLPALFVIAVAAAEAAIGLAVIIAVFRSRGTVNVDDIRTMRL